MFHGSKHPFVSLGQASFNLIYSNRNKWKTLYQNFDAETINIIH